jgi:23S rRNA (adenine2503-C2)-methyltransferase
MGASAFRGRQMAAWLYKKRAQNLDSMTDLPTSLRGALATHGYVARSTAPFQAVRAEDGATKHSLRLADDAVIECVHLPYPDRVSVCLSSQVGCPVGCLFCATGLGGYTRNLTAGEIVEQCLWMQDLHPNRRITHAVFMGMGEPLLNLDAVEDSVRILRDEVGMSARHLTMSTVGIVPGMLRLADAGLPVGLAVSLHAPSDELRARLIPTARRWPIAEVVGAARTYRAKTGRDVTYEYLLIADVNDAPLHARRLGGLLRGEPATINLIPYNPVAAAEGMRAPAPERVVAFRSELESCGARVTQRARRGRGAAGACGQLAGRGQGAAVRRGARVVDGS